MNAYPSITGVIQAVNSLQDTSAGNLCSFLLDLQTAGGPVSLLLTANTYVMWCQPLNPGDTITAFYDPDAPMVLIYPPRYTALAVAKTGDGLQAVLDIFSQDLVNSDGTLQLNPDQNTQIRTPNGQRVMAIPGDSFLMVLYSETTRSIPAITVPKEITVFCRG